MDRLLVGTSGFAYKEWKPEFYPADLKSSEMLAYYAERFSSVEINASFYRMPKEETLRGWCEQTPESFRFTLKAPQRITHIKRLKVDDDTLEHFLAVARVLGPRLGAILFQLPPNMKADLERLEAFLAALPGDPYRFAMEFRHESWSSDEVREMLAASNVAWCVADTDEARASMTRTARSFAYLRLRRLDYDDGALTSWAAAVRPLLDESGEAFVYFKHEDDPSGIRFAKRFRELAVHDGIGPSGA